MSMHKEKQVLGMYLRLGMIFILLLSCIPIYINEGKVHYKESSFDGVGVSSSVLMFSINFHPVLDYIAIKLP